MDIPSTHIHDRSLPDVKSGEIGTSVVCRRQKYWVIKVESLAQS